ncbi:NAD(P)H-dependent oxidoreductase [Alkaliphilus pronyensis]|uniref:NAD(P)H-dependent oxidoreductase n=1 Tax=Alkaliphilus pronyensis TaxID=1482732 RepID=A0A6I0F132_9FIRM|nr:hypothetical protein [Alkaliphilus pronyensis]KAB3536038.1 NAD(P)H-dependent oxidoreductase [Alkaliphilus pronyensis]
MVAKKIILVNGSVRRNKTSYSFARTIKALSEKRDSNADIINAIDYFKGKSSLEDLEELINNCHIIGFIAPVYVDTLPYPTIWFLEELSKKYGEELKGKGTFAIGQCGFPEIRFCQSVLDACRSFAEDHNMTWLGGLGYGGGAMLDGALLEDLGKKGEKMILAFDYAIDNILKGEKIPAKSQELLTVKIPKILYWPLALYLNYKSRKISLQMGATNIEEKPYI